MMRKVRFGVTGCGGISNHFHIPELTDNCRLGQAISRSLLASAMRVDASTLEGYEKEKRGDMV